MTSRCGPAIVVDAPNGAAYHVAPMVFHELGGAEVIAIGCAPDGLNINRRRGATHRAALVAAVKRATVPTTAWRWTAMPTACNGGRRRPPVQRRRTVCV